MGVLEGSAIALSVLMPVVTIVGTGLRNHQLPHEVYWMGFVGAMTGGMAWRKGFSFLAWTSGASIVAILGPGLLAMSRPNLNAMPPFLALALANAPAFLPLVGVAFLPFVGTRGALPSDGRPVMRTVANLIMATLGIVIYGIGAYLLARGR